MAAAVAALTVAVPAQSLVELAQKWKNNDFLATYSREVKTDAATNHTATEVMKLVSGLNKALKDVSGMKTVAEEIANCITPLIRKAGIRKTMTIWRPFSNSLLTTSRCWKRPPTRCIV